MAEYVEDGSGKRYTFRSYKPLPVPPGPTQAVVRCPLCRAEDVCLAYATRMMARAEDGTPLRECSRCFSVDVLKRMGIGGA